MANKTLSFEILRPVIIDAVKTETHIKGVIDKALDYEFNKFLLHN